MMTPQEKYLNDPSFKQLVDMIEYGIEKLQFTPSEVREAALLAALHYDQRQIRRYHVAGGKTDASR